MTSTPCFEPMHLPYLRGLIVAHQPASHASSASLSHPAVAPGTGARTNNQDAFTAETSVRCLPLWPDHAMRAVVQHLAEPATRGMCREALASSLLPYAGCSISHDTFDNPVLASDGFTYSYLGIKNWWQSQADSHQIFTSPMNRQEIIDLRLIPNTAMRTLMAALGLEGCNSPEPDYTAQLISVPPPQETRKAARQWCTVLNYQQDAPALLAASDSRIAQLSQSLREEAQTDGKRHSRLKATVAGWRAQACVRALFVAPKFKAVNAIAKTLRAVDVELQLGHLRRAEALVRQGLLGDPNHAVLLSRLALIEALHNDQARARATIARLLECSPEEACHKLLACATTPQRGPTRSMWPLLATAGLMLLASDRSDEGVALLQLAAGQFPSRALNGF